jgi:hyperosmotically inducible periplasmic protein
MTTICSFLIATISLFIAGCGPSPEAATPGVAKTSVGTEIDDTVTTSKVKAALLADPAIRSFDIKVETRKGRVQLSGFVDNAAQVERAMAITRDVQQVAGVDNAVTLKGERTTLGNKVDDGIITSRVKAALLADPDVKSGDVNVVTRKGEVQLSGFVNSQPQIDLVIAIARKVDGVTGIGNEMTVKN